MRSAIRFSLSSGFSLSLCGAIMRLAGRCIQAPYSFFFLFFIFFIYFFFYLHYRRSLLAQQAGAFHHLGVEVVPNPMTLLEDISGEDIFQSRTVLVKPTLSAHYRASGPSSRGKPLRRRSIFQDHLPAGKAGVPCLASDRATYLNRPSFSLPLLRIRPGFCA